MKKFICPLLILAFVAAISGCGSNSSTSKLIGTEMVSTSGAAPGSPLSIGANTTQSAVLKQTIQDMFPDMIVASLEPCFNNNGSSQSAQKTVAFSKAVTNKMDAGSNGSGGSGVANPLPLAVDGGIASFAWTASGTATPNSSGTGGMLTLTTSLGTTFKGLTVTVNGNSYHVSGTETDSGTMSGTYVQGAGGPSSISLSYSITASNGSITIAGPGCNGTWSYSYTNKGSISYTGQPYFTAQQVNVSGLLGNMTFSFGESNVNITVPGLSK